MHRVRSNWPRGVLGQGASLIKVAKARAVDGLRIKGAVQTRVGQKIQSTRKVVEPQGTTRLQKRSSSR